MDDPSLNLGHPVLLVDLSTGLHIVHVATPADIAIFPGIVQARGDEVDHSIDRIDFGSYRRQRQRIAQLAAGRWVIASDLTS